MKGGNRQLAIGNILPLKLYPFLPGIWRSNIMPDGTLYEIRAVNHGTACVYYDLYEFADTRARGQKLRHLSGCQRLRQARDELADHIRYGKEAHP